MWIGEDEGGDEMIKNMMAKRGRRGRKDLKKPIRIVAASDLHGVVSLEQLNLEGVDICILAGDIAPLKGVNLIGKLEQEAWVLDVFIPFMRKHKGTEFVFIAGNHDFWGLRMMPNSKEWPKNAHYMKNSHCEVKGLRFYGMPDVPYINGVWAFESRCGDVDMASAMIPSGLDVLVTHTPPFISGSSIDTSEGVFLVNGEESHFGSFALADAVIRTKPKYLFCGHIHTGSHACCELGETKCFNVSLLNESYRMSYMPLDVEI